MRKIHGDIEGLPFTQEHCDLLNQLPVAPNVPLDIAIDIVIV
jgi:hypothetical protein